LHVIRHLKVCFAVMGVPKCLKTDSAPAYVGGRVERFLQAWGAKHFTGIAHLSTRQAVVERANRT
ncbi:POK18 protein, partial [Phainopepla nitens]|nr:POK18 protein [Phainopepla nitens]